MRKSLSLAAFVLLTLPSLAQRPEVGFVRIINLVAAGEGNLNCRLDGKELYAPGYTLGQKTGGMGLKVGSYELGFAKTGCRAATRMVEIENDKTQTLIAYGDPVRDDLGEIVGWNIKLARLRQKSPERGYLLTLVSFCEEEEIKVAIAAEGTRKPIKQLVLRMKAQTVKAGRPQGGISVAIGQRPLAAFHTDDPGNYVILIYTRPDGTKAAIHYYDPRFLVAG